jgi:predicted nucleic acid-binding protein
MTETKREFVDTNVLVYAYNNSLTDKQAKARALLDGLWRSEKGGLSIQVLQEFFTVVTRKIPFPLPLDTATQILSDYGSWSCHTPEVNDLLKAISIQRKYGISFWDALIIQSAYQLDCRIIWSEDLNNGQLYEGITALNPFSAPDCEFSR